jgi:hypothetical protein
VALVERLRLELGSEVRVTADLRPLGDRQTRVDPDQDWLWDYQGLTMAECVRAAQQAARPYQVLSRRHTAIDADYRPNRLNVLVDSEDNVLKLWPG